MTTSLLLAVISIVVPALLGIVGVRYVIKRDRADSQAAASAERDRQATAIRVAVGDATAPLLADLTQLRQENRDLRNRRDALLDELRRPRPPGGGS